MTAGEPVVLGLPELPARPLVMRRHSRRIQVGPVAAGGDAGTPIRIGVNAGSPDARLLKKYGKATAEARVEWALWEASLFEEHGFRDIRISLKQRRPEIVPCPSCARAQVDVYKPADELRAGLEGMEVPCGSP